MENSGTAISQYLGSRFDEVHYSDFYRYLFSDGVLQSKRVCLNPDEPDKKKRIYDNDGDGKYNGIVIELLNQHTWYEDQETGEKKKKRTVKRYNVTNDLEVLDDVVSRDNFALISPLAYAGKTREAKNARICFGITIDLDKIRIKDGFPIGLDNFLHQTENEPGTKIGRQPLPTFIVSSGTGCHLYYVFNKPICLFEETVMEMQRLKRALTTKVWHDSVVDIPDERDIQQEGIFQGFRVVGSITKKGDRATAYFTGDRVSVEYLNQYVYSAEKVRNYREYDERYLLGKEPYPEQISLDKTIQIDTKLNYWKKKKPDWYERRVVKKEPRITWAVNRNLYDWWKEEISNKARVSHRYWCISMLAIYAVKCSHYDEKKNPDPVTYEELEKDAFEFVELFDSLTLEEDNHFTDDDVLAALEFWNDSWTFYKRDYVSYRAGFEIKENKRNGRSRADHLEHCRLTKKQQKARGELMADGRPNKKLYVTIWRIEHPNGTIKECCEDTGMSRPTVRKWWNEEDLTIQKDGLIHLDGISIEPIKETIE